MQNVSQINYSVGHSKKINIDNESKNMLCFAWITCLPTQFQYYSNQDVK
jgi:hypothetical protein